MGFGPPGGHHGRVSDDEHVHWTLRRGMSLTVTLGVLVAAIGVILIARQSEGRPAPDLYPAEIRRLSPEVGDQVRSGFTERIQPGLESGCFENSGELLHDRVFIAGWIDGIEPDILLQQVHRGLLHRTAVRCALGRQGFGMNREEKQQS